MREPVWSHGIMRHYSSVGEQCVRSFVISIPARVRREIHVLG